MAISYLSSIDLNKNEIQNGVIQVLATAPSSPAQGQIYFNSTDVKLYFFDGSNWVDASGDIKSVITSTSNTLSITDSNGPNPSVATITAAITNGGTALATGGQIATYVSDQLATIAVAGTANEIEVVESGGVFTVGLPDDVTVAGDMTISGDLTVSGTQTIINTESLTVDDNIITLNNKSAGTPTENAGI